MATTHDTTKRRKPTTFSAGYTMYSDDFEAEELWGSFERTRDRRIAAKFREQRSKPRDWERSKHVR